MPRAATSLNRLSRRALNRAFLARQMLLQRESMPPVKAVERLIGMQAQQPRPPFIGLWTRLEAFERDGLLRALQAREVVRATLMRATLHLMSAKDYVAFRGALEPALSGAMRTIVQSRGASVDMQAVVEAARQCFREKPQTFSELRSTLSTRFPDVDERAMGYIARTALHLVMVPEDGEYGFGGDTKFALASTWLKQPTESDNHVEDLVLRYLAAYGPATAADAQTWSGLPKLKPVFEALRSRLAILHDEEGRELFDVPEGFRPDERTPAPVRFLPAFDNAILSHADRSRIIADEYRGRVCTKNLQVLPTVLVEGFVEGTWSISATKKTATLTISPFQALARNAKQDLVREGELLLPFVAPDSARSEVLFQTAE